MPAPTLRSTCRTVFAFDTYGTGTWALSSSGFSANPVAGDQLVMILMSPPLVADPVSSNGWTYRATLTRQGSPSTKDASVWTRTADGTATDRPDTFGALNLVGMANGSQSIGAAGIWCFTSTATVQVPIAYGAVAAGAQGSNITAVGTGSPAANSTDQYTLTMEYGMLVGSYTAWTAPTNMGTNTVVDTGAAQYLYYAPYFAETDYALLRTTSGTPQSITCNPDANQYVYLTRPLYVSDSGAAPAAPARGWGVRR